MFSAHSQAPMSLITTLSAATQMTTATTTLAVHQQTPTLIVNVDNEGASSFEQQNDFLADFVIDESLNIDFLLKNTNANANSNNNSLINSNTHQSFSIESQMAIQSCLDDLDLDFIQSLDVSVLLDEAEAAVSHSPLEPATEIQLEGDLEFQTLLDSITNEVLAQDDAAAINSPSAEISYAHLTAAMTPFTEESSMDFAPAATVNSTASWSFEDDASSSSSSVTGAKSSKGRRVNQTSGSVTKVSKSKKESNKAAAERYRNKKQMEKLELFAECERDEKRNRELKAEIEEVQVELNFIKNLLVEALLAKKS